MLCYASVKRGTFSLVHLRLCKHRWCITIWKVDVSDTSISAIAGVDAVYGRRMSVCLATIDVSLDHLKVKSKVSPILACFIMSCSSLRRSGMARLNKDQTDLPATHTYVDYWNEPYLSILPSHTASQPFGQYSFPIMLR